MVDGSGRFSFGLGHDVGVIDETSCRERGVPAWSLGA